MGLPGSLAILCHASLATLAISVPTVVDAARGALTRERCDTRLRWWANALLARARVSLEVDGLEALDEDAGPFIVVANHQSHYDIPSLYCALPLRLRMVAKRELFETPIWGRALLAAGFVPVDRTNPRQAVRALHAAGVEMQNHGFSLFVAPEGTRSLDGHVGPFRRGAFDLARITGARILPVAIDGTIRVHASGSWRVGTGKQVVVRILEPITTNGQTSEALAAAVRGKIVDALAARPAPSC